MKNVILFVLILLLSSAAMGAQTIYINYAPAGGISLEMGESCTFTVVSDDSTEYVDYLCVMSPAASMGNFTLLSIEPEAGADANVVAYTEPGFDYAFELQVPENPPEPYPGPHFTFKFEALQEGSTLLFLLDNSHNLIFGPVTLEVTKPEPEPLGTAFTYQGHLYDANRVANSEYDFQFKLFDLVDINPNISLQQGSTITLNEIDVIDGYFTVELDFGNNVFDGDKRWLEIGVRPGEQNEPNEYTTLEPRQEITPVPYALYTVSDPDITAPLELTGAISSPKAVMSGTNTGTGSGVKGENSSTGNYGELGRGDYGVYGYTTINHGVYGKNNTTGNYGYLGSTANGARGWSASGVGVRGGSNDGIGAFGEADTGTGVYGRSTSGIGVFGKHDANNNFGYIASSDYGIYGEYDINDSNNNFGYLASSEYGVYGENRGGCFGYLASASRGVYGYSEWNQGVVGSSPHGYAGFFYGNVYVSKDVSALSFTDRTPYPKDLATAYRAVMSMERLPDGQYMEDDKETQLDHSAMSDFIRSEDGYRDLSATVSCQNEVLKDVIRKQNQFGKNSETIELLKQQVEALLSENELLKQTLETQEKSLQQIQTVIMKGAVQ